MSTSNHHKMIFMLLLIGVLSLTVTVESAYHVEREPTCDCVCRDSFMDATYSHKTLCNVISRFEKELLTVKQEIERRTVFINDIAGLKEIMEDQENSIRILQEQVEKLSSTRVESETLPKPASLVMVEEFMQGDSGREIRRKEDQELVENVSTLFAKVEEVESRTSKVQEELKSEKRVRRHLEEDLNETRFSIQLLDDKLLNVTVPMDSRVTHVEEIVLSTLENMNKTLFEEHLKTLYYKVEGVVYKNETEKLDERLDQVETGLMDASNNNMTLQFAEELNNLTGVLSIMNQTIMEKLAEEEYRMGSLENKTTKLDELEGLQDQMESFLKKTSKLDELEGLQDQMESFLNKTSRLDELEGLQDQMENLINKTVKLDELTELQEQMESLLNKTSKLDEFENLQEQMIILMNVTHLMQTGAIDLWMDIQNIRNATTELEKEFYNQSIATNKTIASVQQEISQKLQVMDDGISSLKSEVLSDQAALRNLQTDLQILSADVAISESKLVNLSEASEKMMKEISSKMENLSGVWDNSLSILASQIENWKNSKGADDASDSSKYITQNKGTAEWKGNVEDEDMDIVRMRGKGSGEQKSCDLPSINDEHLLMSLEKDSNGLEILVFGCRPIGRYALEEGPVSLKCQDGSWDRDPPTCARLKDEAEIILFDPAEKLVDLIPTILIEPDNVDKPFGLMGTNTSGHLIVYPNTNFKLHCLFPENQLGSAIWEVQKFSGGSPYRISYRSLKHRSTVEFNAISSRGSGIYTCTTPYNKKHSIKVVIEAVTCPAFQVGSDREKALTYNSHPDGGERILSTTAQFLCEGGSSISTMCLPNGTWSRAVPTVEECPPRRAKFWGCDVFIKQSDDDPEVTYDNTTRQIHFSCLGSRRLVGSAVATCLKNTWTSEFPKCV